MTLSERQKTLWRITRKHFHNLIHELFDHFETNFNFTELIGVSPPNDEPKPSLPPGSTGEAQATPEPYCEADQASPDSPASRNLNRGTASDWEVHTFDSFRDCNEFCLELCQDGKMFVGPNTIRTNQGTDIEEIKYQILVRK